MEQINTKVTIQQDLAIYRFATITQRTVDRIEKQKQSHKHSTKNKDTIDTSG